MVVTLDYIQTGETNMAQLISYLNAALAAAGMKAGTAVIGDGGIIPHGLGAIPSAALVQATVSFEEAKPSGLDATNITVAIKTNLGAPGSNQTVYWVVFS
jgi:hypothetical protein